MATAPCSKLLCCCVSAAAAPPQYYDMGDILFMGHFNRTQPPKSTLNKQQITGEQEQREEHNLTRYNFIDYCQPTS